MDAMRLDVKVFAAAGTRVEPALLIPVFHGFIQRKAMGDELLIDVADYSHVVDGPGVVLVGHEGQYGYDLAKGRAGLLYSQRRPRITGGLREVLGLALRRALAACALLEKEESLGGKLRFDGQELLIRLNDRLLAPNTPATWKAVEPDVRAVLDRAFGGSAGYSVEPAPAGPEVFTLQVRAAAATSAEALLGRLPA